ncbi:MAG TPA: chromate resistance protein ChrB domain-containing protein [Candidatus Krumholzibacteria bacterium]|nr:chromate resistance protein ChrB domain-containing protein [Candidatus Krumholzibacteria bacterium]
MAPAGEAQWLLLIHQLPPKPDYLRVKVWRRLQRLGAIAIKNSVYVLPRSEQAQEDFQWVLQEIAPQGGEASICEARFVQGLSDAQVEAMFRSARDADYAVVAEEARRAREDLPRRATIAPERRAQGEAELARLKRRRDEIVAIDFLGAPGRVTADAALTALESRLRAASVTAAGHGRASKPTAPTRMHGRTWVTRKGIHIDRIASAWLIRKCIDPKARFRFVAAKGYRPAAGELRFDMFAAEYTHQGDHCTFEVLLQRFGLDDPALRHIAEIVHDIDLKDCKFRRPEAPGIERLIAGICMSQPQDPQRLTRGAAVFDDLYRSFRRSK